MTFQQLSVIGALNVRDKIAAKIAEVPSITLDEGRRAAEILLRAGYINTAMLSQTVKND